MAPEAVEDFKLLPARGRSIMHDAIETHLRYEPEKVSHSQIKRLRGIVIRNIGYQWEKSECSTMLWRKL